jgi:copper chaperone CopZ
MSETITVSVGGMKCAGCESSLTKALQALSGVVTVEASHSQQRVQISYESTKTDLETLENAIVAAGFQLL